MSSQPAFLIDFAFPSKQMLYSVYCQLSHSLAVERGCYTCSNSIICGPCHSSRATPPPGKTPVNETYDCIANKKFCRVHCVWVVINEMVMPSFALEKLLLQSLITPSAAA